eukprot:5111508-Pleurochrysis_carterae.AAC.2
MMREVIIQRCVATCDECHENEGDAAHGEPVCCMVPHFCCTCESASERVESFLDGVARVADACEPESRRNVLHYFPRIGPFDVVAGTTTGRRSFGLRYVDTRGPDGLLSAWSALTMVSGVALALALASSFAVICVRRAPVVRVLHVGAWSPSLRQGRPRR